MNIPDNFKVLYRREEAAEALSVSLRTVDEWIAGGALRSVKLNGCRRIPRTELERVAERGLAIC